MPLNKKKPKNYCGNKEIHAFDEDISPKVNLITCLEFELAYNDFAVQNVTETPLYT